jgi:hypothetical protein
VTIDFQAIFELGAAFETPERFCTQLAEEPEGIRETVERYRHEWRTTAWSVEPDEVRKIHVRRWRVPRPGRRGRPGGSMSKELFKAELCEGHKDVTVVIVPFDPEDVWQLKPVKLDPRRDGWIVKGTLNRTRFDGYIGCRWGKFFIIIEPELRSAAKVSVGDTLSIAVEPTATAKALAKAREQSRMTTAPRRGRADAVEPQAVRRRTSARRTARARPR